MHRRRSVFDWVDDAPIGAVAPSASRSKKAKTTGGGGAGSGAGGAGVGAPAQQSRPSQAILSKVLAMPRSRSPSEERRPLAKQVPKKRRLSAPAVGGPAVDGPAEPAPEPAPAEPPAEPVAALGPSGSGSHCQDTSEAYAKAMPRLAARGYEVNNRYYIWGNTIIQRDAERPSKRTLERSMEMIDRAILKVKEAAVAYRSPEPDEPSFGSKTGYVDTVSSFRWTRLKTPTGAPVYAQDHMRFQVTLASRICSPKPAQVPAYVYYSIKPIEITPDGTFVKGKASAHAIGCVVYRRYVLPLNTWTATSTAAPTKMPDGSMKTISYFTAALANAITEICNSKLRFIPFPDCLGIDGNIQDFDTHRYGHGQCRDWAFIMPNEFALNGFLERYIKAIDDGLAAKESEVDIYNNILIVLYEFFAYMLGDKWADREVYRAARNQIVRGGYK